MQQIALEPAEKAAGKKRVCSRPYKSKLRIAGDVFRKENVSCFLFFWVLYGMFDLYMIS